MSSAAAAAADQQPEEDHVAKEETHWVDASIRWDDHQDTVNNADSDDDVDGPMNCFDPFKEDPSQTFSFRFRLPSANDDGITIEEVPSAACDNSDGAASASLCKAQDTTSEDLGDDNCISIELNGYKYDSDETFNSTGLTLWRAAEHLCHYMVRHSDVLQNKRVLELGCGLGLCGILAHKLCALQTSGSDSVSMQTGAVQ